ncbi:MAG: oxidoreductase, partial [Lentisphaerae bacterium GWF2_52_8]
MSQSVKVGVIGCGNISQAYFNAGKNLKAFEIVACADLNMDAARAKAQENGIKAVSVEEILTMPDVGIILNLTTPLAHTEVNLRALESGKHVYLEKPLAVDRKDGQKVLNLAKKTGLRVGCAPDTFLGAGGQTCRKIIDDAWIGTPLAGTAFMMCGGHESWHPNPGFYYLKGGGPMFDMGPYYLTALVNLLGPVKRVCSSSSMPLKNRVCTCKARYGELLPVETPTHITGVADFACGASVSITMSFDVRGHEHSPIEIYGSKGSLKVPDPNCFGGAVKLFRPGSEGWRDIPYSHIYSDNMRSLGLADMAAAIVSGRPHRCSAELAFHVLDVMQAFLESSEQGRHLEIGS